MTTPHIKCTVGTFVERMNEAIRFSEKSRARVSELGREIGDEARAELARQYQIKRVNPPSPAMLNTVADAAIEKDARWKSAVGDENWGYRLTTMYGIAELVAAQREANAIARHQHQITRQLVAEQETTNKLLRMLLDALKIPADPPVPDQRHGS